MSDPTINQLLASLKRLNKQVEKLGRKIDQLDILLYRYQRLSTAYKQLFEPWITWML
jgi:prefoldin subunit 5